MAVKLNRGSSISDINVTPLVDVMLVLLVIFMVTAPLLETRNQAVNVDLPQVRAAKANVAEDAVVITLDKKHDMYINDNPLVASALKEDVASSASASSTNTRTESPWSTTCSSLETPDGHAYAAEATRLSPPDSTFRTSIASPVTLTYM